MARGEVPAQGGAVEAEDARQQGQDEGLDRCERTRVGSSRMRRDGDAQGGGGLGAGWRN